jgi:hypothetical protein
MDAPLDQARSFVAANGRAIDQARFAVQFDGQPVTQLLDALTAYQLPDGGFGRGLEPDIGAPASNPFATELALEYCLLAGVPRDAPLLARAVAYLEQTQQEDGGWRFSEEVYQHELAPWFQGWQWPNINPSCTIAGLLRELGLGSPRLHAGVERLFAAQQNVADLAGDDFYAARPYAYYLLPEWEHPRRELYRAGLLWWLIRGHLGGSTADAAHFFAYVRTPHSFTGRHLPAEIIAAQLERMLAEQESDGGWPSPYAPHWRAPITLGNLITLRAFGRI